MGDVLSLRHPKVRRAHSIVQQSKNKYFSQYFADLTKSPPLPNNSSAITDEYFEQSTLYQRSILNMSNDKGAQISVNE